MLKKLVKCLVSLILLAFLGSLAGLAISFNRGVDVDVYEIIVFPAISAILGGGIILKSLFMEVKEGKRLQVYQKAAYGIFLAHLFYAIFRNLYIGIFNPIEFLFFYMITVVVSTFIIGIIPNIVLGFYFL